MARLIRPVAALSVLALGPAALALAGSREAVPQAPAHQTAAAKGGGACAARPLFGDTHVHTGWSADAGLDGAITTPEDAFRFARGDTVTSNSGQKARLSRPLDWMVITDHSDGMGVIGEISGRNPVMMADPVVRKWAEALASGQEDRMQAAKLEVIDLQSNGRLPKVIMNPKWMVSAWEKTIATADRYDDPGRFSALIGYEWTVNAGGGDNLHRNVIFRDSSERAGRIIPLTTFETQDPEGLWSWMGRYEKTTGGRVLAIPHNGNLSNGRMYEETRFDGSPMTRAYAEARQRWEPLMELTQFKGQSESHPSLSPSDAFARWDLWDKGNLNGVPKKPGMIRSEYWREALKSGLRLEARLGANPFKYGAEAATDTHTGLSTPDDSNFWGKFRTVEPGADRMAKTITAQYVGWEQAASGLTAVWASANSRAAIWDALKRREAYATTGPRITLRFFGGFDLGERDLAELAGGGCGRGVPMGGDLKASAAGRAPSFLIAARKDPEGANLDRVQVVKGWLEADGTTREKIHDVRWAGDRRIGADGKLPPVGNTVDLKNATYRNTIGASQLVVRWRDPDFDPNQKAVYYVRVLEIPTPRWTAYDQVRFRVKAPENATLIQQERALSSPIWYSPG
ncbi:MAG: DUF3604 domain-containing protein [Synechococcaceae cyanobacterium]|nr:DUF3604 domain-containing protein [Synechococcaceae cyanobacterium]